MTDIHPTAVISDTAHVGKGYKIGPFSLVEAGVTLGHNVKIGARVSLLGNVIIGDDVEIHDGSIIGGQAQSKGYIPDGTERVEIGARTIIREMVTINAGHHPHGGVTRIGEDGYMMIQTHLAHDCIVGDRCVLANSAMLAGHVQAGDDVWFGGGCMVHQFQEIGSQAIVAGGAVVVSDIPPFCVGMGNPVSLAGINTRGLKRRNFTKPQMHAMRKAYRMIFEDDAGSLESRINSTEQAYDGDPHIAELITFLRAKRKRPLAMAK